MQRITTFVKQTTQCPNNKTLPTNKAGMMATGKGEWFCKKELEKEGE
jgi:hypothetical protein